MKDKKHRNQFPVSVPAEPIAATQEIPQIMSDTKTTVDEPIANKVISSEDLVQLQLKYKDFQLATLQQKLAVQELEKAVELARSELVKCNDAVNLKYRLDPSKDRINLQDGVIARG